MDKLWSRFKSNKFLVSFSVLASGSVIAQIISMLISPITTRLFTPEQFGSYTAISTAVSLFGPIICLKYDMAIVTAKTEKDTYSLIKLCILICIPLSILISVIYGLIFLNDELFGISLIISIPTIVVLLILYGLNNILLAHNNKNGLYKLISSVTVIKSFVNNSIMVISGLLNAGVIGLVSSQVISSLAGFGRQSIDLRQNLHKIKEINYSSLKESLQKYKRQPIFNASSALVTTSIYSSINLFIKSVYSTHQLGLYSFSYRILGIPFSVVSANVARIFFESAVKERKNSGDYKKTFRHTFAILCFTIIPMIFLLALMAPWVFSIVFGAEWMSAGVYVRLLAPMFAIRLIAESLTTSFIVSNKQHIELIIQIALFIGEILVYVITYFWNLPIENFLVLISILYLAVHGIMVIVMYKLSEENVYNVNN